MRKVIVVDDEPRHRKGLANLLRMLRPSYEIFEARNGEEALGIIEVQQVSIVITDIRMPVMDGLKLLQKIGNEKNLKVVILSAYGYFDYAQQAIKLGACDYILKPVDEDKMVEVLHRVEEKMEKEEMERELKNREYLLRQLLKGVLTVTEQSALKSIYKDNAQPGILLLFEFIQLDSEGMKIEIEVYLQKFGATMSFFLDETSNILVVIISKVESNILTDAAFVDMLHQLITKCDITISTSKYYRNIQNNIQPAFEQAHTALQYKFYLGTGKVFFYNENSWFEDRLVIHSHKEDELVRALQNIDKKGAVYIVNEIFQNLIKGTYYQPEILIENTMRTVINVISRFENIITESQYYQLITFVQTDMRSSDHITLLQNNVHKVLMNTMELLEERFNKKTEILMKECKAYIDQNYMEDLSLEAVANKFYYNSSYFSQFFKKYYGMTFSKYLLNKRMSVAKNLLLETNKKVYKIAQQSGYKDSKYFNRIFKKEVGLSPEQYRKLHIHSNRGKI
ncbi:MAG TPA: response regulator [Bacillaceae bacterium]|nr:response regulator [Bacillaceae bacterium]